MYRQAALETETAFTLRAFALILGTALLAALPVLPSVALAVTLAIALVAASWRWSPFCLPACLALGLAHAVLAATGVIAERWPDRRWNETVTAVFAVADFTGGTPQRRTLTLDTEEAGLPRRLRLSWYRTEAHPTPGERWRLTVRLRPPRGFANPGSFDYERWLFARRIGATGYVVSGERLGPAPGVHAAVNRLRGRIAGRLEAALGGGDASAVLIALAVGSRHRFDTDLREGFIATGTSHLMAISGLHVGLVAAIGLIIGRLAMLPVRSSTAVTASLPAVLALAAAVAYSALAGFSVPTQRACLMLAVVVILSRAAEPPRPLTTLAAAGLVVVTVDPLAAIDAPFRLSFGIVALIVLLAASDRARGRSKSRFRFVRWQLGLSLLSLPLTLALFGQASAVGPLANLLAIPWFSLLVVPLLFAGVALDFATDSHALLDAAERAAALGLSFLSALADLPVAILTTAAVGPLTAVALALVCGVGLLPLRWPPRIVTVLVALPAVWPRAVPAPPHGCADILAFDVGQGQSVLVRTERHALLYDTAYGDGRRSVATLSVLPALSALGIDELTAVVVSHDDADHAGGLDSILERFGEVPVLTPASVDEGTACVSGRRWRVDGVLFEVLHPPAGSRAGNDGSCVVRVDAGGTSALLSGDIERAAELNLIQHARDALDVDLLLVPHHGSRTSSTGAFVRATSPEQAWVSAGYRNRWGFPHGDVVERYRALGAEVRTTGVEGLLEARLCHGDVDYRDGFRQRDRRVWRAY